MSGQPEFSFKPELENPALIISWTVDAIGLGEQVTDYLNRELRNRCFYDIEPNDYFPLHGVTIENDIIQLPESRFFAGVKKNIIVFQSPPPRFEWYRFINLLLEVARDYCHVNEIYTIDSMVSLIAHTAPREILGNFSSVETKNELEGFGLGSSWNYETPPGQRPTLNSFLLWSAQQKNMRAAALWVPIPFYMVTIGDFQAQQRVLEFLNRRLNLGMTLADLDERTRWQNSIIMQACETVPEIDRLIKKVEAGDQLSPEESQQLVMEIGKHLADKTA
jgi:proteasome assembly chaperone (PAC2) family protein